MRLGNKEIEILIETIGHEINFRDAVNRKYYTYDKKEIKKLHDLKTKLINEITKRSYKQDLRKERKKKDD